MLCAECGQRLSEVELRCSGMPPVANRVILLNQQLEELREFETGLVVVDDVLQRVVTSHMKLVQVSSPSLPPCLPPSLPLFLTPSLFLLPPSLFLTPPSLPPPSLPPSLPQLGANVSLDLSELVKRFQQRWSDIKQKITSRHSSIDKAMVKYDPENMGIASEGTG